MTGPWRKSGRGAPAQLRALLTIERAGRLNLNKLAAALGASASAASRLCDRMEAAGLLSRDRAVSRREIVLVPTGWPPGSGSGAGLRWPQCCRP